MAFGIWAQAMRKDILIDIKLKKGFNLNIRDAYGVPLLNKFITMDIYKASYMMMTKASLGINLIIKVNQSQKQEGCKKVLSDLCSFLNINQCDNNGVTLWIIYRGVMLM